MASPLPSRATTRRITVLSAAALVAALPLAALGMTVPASASPGTEPALSGNHGFTALIEGDTTFASTSETEGSWAIGGNLDAQNKYTIMAGGHQAPGERPVVAGTAVRLIVDGALTMAGGQNTEVLNLSAEGHPNVILGAANTGYTVQPNGRIRSTGGYLIAGSPGIPSETAFAPDGSAFSDTFAGAFSNYRALSDRLYSLSGTGVTEVTVTEGPLNGTSLDASSIGLTLADSTVNVWNVTPGQLQAMQNGKFNLKFHAGATPSADTPLVINLPAGTTTLNNPSFASANVAPYVLWNADTASLTLSGPRLFSGSVLAPDAAFVFQKSTPLEGQIVAATAVVRGSGEIHHVRFVPSIPAVPSTPDPDSPAEPEHPADPTEPEQPTDPTEPETTEPEDPAPPVTPGEEEPAPDTPDVPLPGDESGPGDTTTPIEPNLPNEPVDPENPDQGADDNQQPTQPETPGTPEESDAPQDPAPPIDPVQTVEPVIPIPDDFQLPTLSLDSPQSEPATKRDELASTGIDQGLAAPLTAAGIMLAGGLGLAAQGFLRRRSSSRR